MGRDSLRTWRWPNVGTGRAVSYVGITAMKRKYLRHGVAALAAGWLLTAPALAVDIVVWTHRDRLCGRPAAEVPNARTAKQQVPVMPTSGLMRERLDAYVSGVLHVGADGFVEKVEVIDQFPERSGVTDKYVEAMKKWVFAPGVAETYCVTSTFDFHIEKPWDDATLAVAPAPVAGGMLQAPQKAVADAAAGSAVVGIVIGADGLVQDAALLFEAPQDYGFGDTALAAVKAWRFEAGNPGRFRVLVRFPRLR